MSQKNNYKDFEFIKTSGDIDEFILSRNDLRVLLLEDHAAPVTTLMVTYHVGSRNEAIGYTRFNTSIRTFNVQGVKKL